MNGWGWFAASLTMLIVSALIVAVTVLVVRAVQRDGTDGRRVAVPDARRAPAAEGLLAERFARGEIDDDEYERRLAVLRRHVHGPALS
ncbi:SHOCT domain-containing protein [Streptomyces bambusae]|uniref:SHOCT domain-containing protein n=1 Tax=Streptomyces bambusae TaxID=1550616 RepID=UPI001CFCA5CB|nr:SHOCT domain-containing protein [Streptomyces bambusae]MCB5163843.1 SHOCT domain-containing protein [Streptomyces bambusae]